MHSGDCVTTFLRVAHPPGNITAVPPTAEHAAFGVLDTSQDDLGGAVSWKQVHRVLVKVSKLGLRFFAHGGNH